MEIWLNMAQRPLLCSYTVSRGTDLLQLDKLLFTKVLPGTSFFDFVPFNILDFPLCCCSHSSVQWP